MRWGKKAIRFYGPQRVTAKKRSGRKRERGKGVEVENSREFEKNKWERRYE